MLERFHLAVAIVTMIGSAVFLLALMMMLVDERRDTVGMLRLIGFTRRRILMQVFAEGTLIAAAGTAFGVLFAAGHGGRVQSLLPVALRHRADFRAAHSGRDGAVGGPGHAARASRRA